MGVVEQVVVVEWLKPSGATVIEGEPVVVVETDKADVELPAPVDGVLEIDMEASDSEVPVQSVLAHVVTV